MPEETTVPPDAADPGRARAGRIRVSHRWESHALYLVALGLAYYTTVESDSPTHQWMPHVLLLPFVVAAVLARKRLPYALPIVGVIGFALGTSAAFPVGMASLAVRRRGLRVWGVGILGWAVALATVYRRFFEASWETTVQLVPLGFLGFAALPILIGGYIRGSREREAAAVARAVRAEVEREQAAARAVGAERERIAHEMHDSLGHVLSLVTTQAGALEVSTTDPSTRTAAESIRSTARRGLADLRAVVRALGDEDVSRGPARGLAAIPALIEESRRAGATVSFADGIGIQTAEVPDSIGRVLYRLVQEALTNAHRHAPGSPVDVDLSGASGARVSIAVGNPLAPGGERGAGSGLGTLRNRVELLGGTLDARAARGMFELRAELPWEAP
ncbi:MAG: histidine kinase [Microbacterium sp.]|uniref:sensor histidine kinase n=1 Tax=Microbacterium sp. TaxID=51671 RepID=UPI0039E4347B